MIGEIPYLAEWLVKRALELGADEAEASFSVYRERSVKSEGAYPKALSRASVDVWIRVAKGKRVAIVTATSLDRDVLSEILERGVAMARVAEEDPHWGGLPDPEGPTHGWVGFDEGVATLGADWLIAAVRELAEEVRGRFPDVKVTGSGASAASGYSYVYNSRGLRAEDRGTSMGVYLSTKASHAGGEGTGFAFIHSRSMVAELEGLAERASRLALDAARGEKLGSSVTGNVLFKPYPLAELLDYLLVPALNAMNVLEGLSPLRDKVGEKVLGEMTLLDDGTLPGGIETSLFDAEGVPRRRTLLVERGVLRGYLHNTYTARRMSTKSTGNAGRARGSYTVSRSNMVVEGGDESEEELARDAAVVVDGSLLSVHTVNYVTGNFSVVATNPYLVKNGELKPLKPVTIAGNIYQSAPTLRFSRTPRNTYTGFYLPETLVGKVTVSG
ncbi:TldD/PmbA family protein [Thermofilum pendens]|uniref:Peptidase U62, modulator of DNA gyrase n=1 Tax=Thermofilum pendens (strain DSM 2475 / Hrk 5) TaxID=368408 RepID=A1RW74_THEPD|nr:TldD/PmbA family protein [Thermofilum pendens]ABL77454.1 peptidase U62, modulator of DNA gyrase [Thermofilum pendens Hrk 5]